MSSPVLKMWTRSSRRSQLRPLSWTWIRTRTRSLTWPDSRQIWKHVPTQLPKKHDGMRPFARNPKDEGLDDGRTTGGGLNDGTVCMDATQVQAEA